MAYDEKTAARVRHILSGQREVVEKRMVGETNGVTVNHRHSAPGSSTPAPTEQDASAITRSSAVELAARIASGALSSVEVVEAHIEQIERVNGALNAVVLKRYERAREEARPSLSPDTYPSLL